MWQRFPDPLRRFAPPSPTDTHPCTRFARRVAPATASHQRFEAAQCVPDPGAGASVRQCKVQTQLVAVVLRGVIGGCVPGTAILMQELQALQ